MNPFAAGLAGYLGASAVESYRNAYVTPQQLPYGYGLNSPEEVLAAEQHPGLYQTYLYQESQRIAAEQTAAVQAKHRATVRGIVWSALIVVALFAGFLLLGATS